MTKLQLLFLTFLLCLGCKKDHKNLNTDDASAFFDLSATINKELDSIQMISQLIIETPDKQQDHDTNDSITRKISVYTENIINALIESHGKTPTDTILTILKRLDNSGYIPIELYKKLSQEDFSTEIGQKARIDYQNYVKLKEEETNSLKPINLLDKRLSLHRIIENDTIILGDLLLEHKGYKVLDFWATWCAPCRSFNTKFQEHYSLYRNKGVEFYGVGIRIDSDNEREKFLTAVKNDNTPWKQFVDIDNQIYTLFNTNTVPYQVLLDENNQVIKILSHDINHELDELLKNK